MKRFSLILVSMFTLSLVFAQKMGKTVEVGGAAMYPSKNIVQNAVNSADHTTLVAAVKASMNGKKLILTDEKGGMSAVTISDVYQSNGVIHVIDKVLLPS